MNATPWTASSLAGLGVPRGSRSSARRSLATDTCSSLIHVPRSRDTKTMSSAVQRNPLLVGCTVQTCMLKERDNECDTVTCILSYWSVGTKYGDIATCGADTRSRLHLCSQKRARLNLAIDTPRSLSQTLILVTRRLCFKMTCNPAVVECKIKSNLVICRACLRWTSPFPQSGVPDEDTLAPCRRACRFSRLLPLRMSCLSEESSWI